MWGLRGPSGAHRDAWGRLAAAAPGPGGAEGRWGRRAGLRPPSAGLGWVSGEHSRLVSGGLGPCGHRQSAGVGRRGAQSEPGPRGSAGRTEGPHREQTLLQKWNPRCRAARTSLQDGLVRGRQGQAQSQAWHGRRVPPRSERWGSRGLAMAFGDGRIGCPGRVPGGPHPSAECRADAFLRPPSFPPHGRTACAAPPQV